jgi:plasmid maintenance system antidote protein VapI
MIDNTATLKTVPIVIEEDEKQGLILGLAYHKSLRSYCTKWMRKPDNISTNIPKKRALSNTATLIVINALDSMPIYDRNDSLVISSGIDKQWLKYAFSKWRHTNHKIRSIYIQKALAKRAREQDRNQYAITMRFSPKLGLKIIKNGGALYIQARLTNQLKRALGYSPDMWLQLEAVCSEKQERSVNYNIAGKGSVSRSNGILHMHGAITLNESELMAVRRVVRSLNRSTSSVFKNHELDLTLIDDELGWVDYCNKHPVLNTMFLNGVSRYSRTKRLGGIAQKLYEEERGKYKAESVKVG